MAHHVTLIPEWAEQDLVLITWPNATMDWAYMLPEIESCYIELAHAILEWEDLLVLARDPERVRTLLMTKPLRHELFVMEMDTNDTWCRDYAPLSLSVRDEAGTERPMIVDFTFNAWGLKFPAHKDNLVSRALFLSRSFIAEMSYTNALSLTFEGGGIESDGQGTLLTTASVLFEPNRNAGLSEEALQGYLREVLGADRLIVLEHGALEGDDTDGHIDTLARFLSPTQIAYVGCTDGNDPHYQALGRMRGELEELRTAEGEPYELIELPLPPAIYDEEGERLPATYANFLFVNGALLVPIYNVETDELALETLRQALPDRTIVPVYSRPLVKQHGSLHCATMQFPRGFMNKGKWRE
jgi:Peptidylarginine deiminase and related enzymes